MNFNIRCRGYLLGEFKTRVFFHFRKNMHLEIKENYGHFLGKTIFCTENMHDCYYESVVFTGYYF